MPKRLLLAAFIVLFGWSSMARADERQAVLHVKNMFCSLCEATVSRAIKAVPGVIVVEVNRGAQVATVVYDDDLAASPEDLAAAATAAGYPASPTK